MSRNVNYKIQQQTRKRLNQLRNEGFILNYTTTFRDEIYRVTLLNGVEVEFKSHDVVAFRLGIATTLWKEFDDHDNIRYALYGSKLITRPEEVWTNWAKKEE